MLARCQTNATHLEDGPQLGRGDLLLIDFSLQIRLHSCHKGSVNFFLFLYQQSVLYHELIDPLIVVLSLKVTDVFEIVLPIYKLYQLGPSFPQSLIYNC